MPNERSGEENALKATPRYRNQILMLPCSGLPIPLRIKFKALFTTSQVLHDVAPATYLTSCPTLLFLLLKLTALICTPGPWHLRFAPPGHLPGIPAAGCSAPYTPLLSCPVTERQARLTRQLATLLPCFIFLLGALSTDIRYLLFVYCLPGPVRVSGWRNLKLCPRCSACISRCRNDAGHSAGMQEIFAE